MLRGWRPFHGLESGSWWFPPGGHCFHLGTLWLLDCGESTISQWSNTVSIYASEVLPVLAPFSLFTYIRSLNNFLFSLSLLGFFSCFSPRDTGQTIQEGTCSSSWCHFTTLPFSILPHVNLESILLLLLYLDPISDCHLLSLGICLDNIWKLLKTSVF